MNVQDNNKIENKTMKKADLIVDLQYGSTGKGLIAGYLAIKNEYDVIVTANMPNAGHTFIDDRGNKMVHKVLPNGLVSPKCEYVLIGAGAVFSYDQLIKELEQLKEFGYDRFHVCIHQHSVVLTDEHREGEQHQLRIGSTAQGSAAAMIHKIDRDPEHNPTAGNTLVIDGLPENISVVDNDQYDDIIRDAKNILLEGAQGFSLGINERFYPYCTSRECTPARFLSDMGIPLPLLRKVIGTARTYPIRVGSPEGGFSGDVYPDQEETSWEELGLSDEFTTVTKRKRRVFTFSKKQIADAMWAVQPDEVFLNFCNYITENKRSSKLNEIIDCFEGKVSYMGFGPTVDDVQRGPSYGKI